MKPIGPTVSRRDFFASTAGAGLLGGASAAGPPSPGGIEAEIRRRAEQYLGQRYLTVDYYRIGRRLAYPLPVSSLSLPAITVPSISEYPWATWMLWELEERVNALGWAAEWLHNQEFARAAARDLEALSGWPKYCQYRQPDLSSGHAGRLLWTAYTYWHWLEEPLRAKIRAACARHTGEVSPLVDAYYGPIRSKQDLLALPEPYRKLPNIPLIGTLGAALTAAVAKHPAAPALNEKVRAVMGAILDLRAGGHSEAVGYDGYILDFAADWMEAVSAGERNPILEHPRLQDYLDESYMLGAPGAAEEVAELSDVEPKQMPFHYSAQAKLARLEKNPVRDWYLLRWPLDWMRANALGALHPIIGRLRGTAPEAGALNVHYAMVLRSGWEPGDLALVMSCSNSPMGHLQNDNGTVVIGTRGRWIIGDPGYQQYMQGSEREFTIGPAAHNYPVINGAAQDKRRPRLLQLEREEGGVLHARVELGECYPREAGIRSLVRSAWQVGNAGVVIADQVAADAVRSVEYHWHGHPEAAWWSRDGWMLLHLPDADLWFTSREAKIGMENVQRLPGSRGQLTLVAPADPARSVFWWAFAVSAAPGPLESLDNGSAVRFLGRRFQV